MGAFCFVGFFFPLTPLSWEDVGPWGSADVMFGAVGAPSVAAAKLLLPTEVKNVT